MSKRECHPKFSEQHSKKVEIHTKFFLIEISVINRANNYHEMKKKTFN
jgi:hypothetical protein